VPRERGVWIWSKRVDLGVFGGSALLALSLAGGASWLAPEGALPEWAFFVFVIGLDVAHVWTTLYRTYLDRAEVARRRALYFGLPVACYLLGFLLHLHSALTFWRALAYVAVFHFVRQQVGWVAIYRARGGEYSRSARWLDDAVIYAATGFPLLYWHAHLPRKFHWFVPDDFAAAPWLQPLVWPAAGIYLALLVAYALRALARARSGRVDLGKHVVVASTALVWFVGIVAMNDDFGFTVTNITVHAIPYMALLWAYGRERSVEAPASLLSRVVGLGIGAFLALALLLAFAEEMLWERLVWHDRPGWFGGAGEALLSDLMLALVVPLLAVPQAVHYALDGFLWRSKDAGAAQARALGFAPRAA
jgi:hypothetical protein